MTDELLKLIERFENICVSIGWEDCDHTYSVTGHAVHLGDYVDSRNRIREELIAAIERYGEKQ